MISLRTILILVLSLFVLILPVGCSFTDEEKPTPPASILENKEVPRTAGEVPVVTMDGSAGNTLPEGYPEEIVPLMEGSTITLSSMNEDKGKNIIYWVAFISPKGTNEIRDFYRVAFKNAENVQQVDISDEFSISGSKKDKSFSISISSDEIDGQKQSIVSIMIGPKEFLEFKE